MSAQDLMGAVIFGEPAEAVSQEQVAAAIQAAGMSEKLGEHLNPRSWFIRATRELAKKLPEVVLRDLCVEDEHGIKFAFVSRFLAGEDVSYKSVCEVYFNRETQGIQCVRAPVGKPAQEVEAEALELLNSAKSTWNPQDLNALVKRYLATWCRQLPLRPGVSFIARQFAAQAEAVQKFYEALKVPFYRLEVGYQPKLAKQVQEAIVADLKAQVGAILAEIRALKASGDLTARKSRGRLRELQKALREYRDLAQASRLEIDDMIHTTGEAGKALVAASEPEDAILARIQSGSYHGPVEIAALIAADAEVEIDLSKIQAPSGPKVSLDLAGPDAAPIAPAQAAGSSVTVDLGGD